MIEEDKEYPGYNGFWPQIKLSGGRVITKESDLRIEERRFSALSELEKKQMKKHVS